MNSTSASLGDDGGRHLAMLGVDCLELVGHGLIFNVHRARLDGSETVVIRSPRHRWHPTGLHTYLDTNLFLKQETVMTAHARAHGIPSPEMYIDWSAGEPAGFSVAEYVPHDGSPLPSSELGRVMGRIHTLPLPATSLVEQGDRTADDVVLHRLVDQARSIQDLAEVPFELDENVLRERLEGWEPGRSILHMDLRDVNLLTRGGELIAVIDWGNVMIGDPALEWARMEEFGVVNDEFIQGYTTIRPRPSAPDAVWLLYRLDTAVMLAAIHFQFSLGEREGHAHLERARQLRDQLLSR